MGCVYIYIYGSRNRFIFTFSYA